MQGGVPFPKALFPLVSDAENYVDYLKIFQANISSYLSALFSGIIYQHYLVAKKDISLQFTKVFLLLIFLYASFHQSFPHQISLFTYLRKCSLHMDCTVFVTTRYKN